MWMLPERFFFGLAINLAHCWDRMAGAIVLNRFAADSEHGRGGDKWILASHAAIQGEGILGYGIVNVRASVCIYSIIRTTNLKTIRIHV